jgi:hypothetical protein
LFNESHVKKYLSFSFDSPSYVRMNLLSEGQVPWYFHVGVAQVGTLKKRCGSRVYLLLAKEIGWNLCEYKYGSGNYVAVMTINLDGK